MKYPLVPGVFAPGSESSKFYGIEDGRKTLGIDDGRYAWYNANGVLLGSGDLSHYKMTEVAEKLGDKQLFLVEVEYDLDTNQYDTPSPALTLHPKLVASFLLTKSEIRDPQNDG